MTSSTLGLAFKSIFLPQQINTKVYPSTDRKARFHREKTNEIFLPRKNRV